MSDVVKGPMFPCPPWPGVGREELYPGPSSPPRETLPPPLVQVQVQAAVVKLAVSQSGSQIFGVSRSFHHTTGSGIVFTQASL